MQRCLAKETFKSPQYFWMVNINDFFFKSKLKYINQNNCLFSFYLSIRLMGIARSSVLSFVIDTTGSMSNDIAEAKRVAFSIIDSKKGTQDEPSEYILVPFNDPGECKKDT